MAGQDTGTALKAASVAAETLRRVRLVRRPISVAAAVFAGLWAFTPAGGFLSVAGFLAVAAALLTRRVPPAAGPAPAEATDLASALPLAGYAAVAGALPDPCFVIDRAGRVLFENTAARKLFGGIETGNPVTLLLRAPEVSDAVQRALATSAPASVTYFERVPADRWFEARVSPLVAPPPAAPSLSARPVSPPPAAAPVPAMPVPAISGTAGAAVASAPPPAFLLLLRDLTEAQRVERMRVDFIANASHELRTPLASLSGFIETLQGPARNDTAARERFLEVMAEQARRMSRLIDDLLSLSRIELKAHVRPETVVDLAPILEHVADAMHPLAIESGVELVVDVRERPLTVVGDRDELAQVFQNLVHNAIKYGQSGGRVEATATRESRGPGKPARIRGSVRDYGPGIAAEHLPRLTERFYRVDTASSREKGGTGLGLAIVKHILNRHRGQLTVESSPGEGAEFTVTLDAAGNDEAPAIATVPGKVEKQNQ